MTRTRMQELIPPSLVSLFSESELELLIAGLPSIDLADLRAHTEYAGYRPGEESGEEGGRRTAREPMLYVPPPPAPWQVTRLSPGSGRRLTTSTSRTARASSCL